MPSTKLKNNSDVGEYSYGQIGGFYVHSSPPRVFQVNPNSVRQWLKNGDLTRLEEMVLQGRGQQLIGQYSPDPRVRYFLKQVPTFMTRINEIHEATARGDLATVQRLAKTPGRYLKNILSSKKGGGLSLLHKAVYYGHPKIIQFVLSSHPESVQWKDCEGRTCLHYCGSSTASGKIWQMLTKAGADPSATDSRGRLPSYYMERGNEISLPTERIFADDTSQRSGIPIKPSNIRIWIHDRDLEKLQKVIWEGHGGKLLTETSNNLKVKRFLEGVPHALNAIKDVHAAVIDDDFEELVKRTSGSVPVEILASKDVNGLNPLHKASGLGRLNIAKYIIQRKGDLINSVDEEGRTPLHFAAAASKTDDSTYKFLVSKNGDETALDINGKEPSYYRNNPKELMKYLKVVPEAPRTAYRYPFHWDWMGMPSGESTPPILAPIQEVPITRKLILQPPLYDVIQEKVPEKIRVPSLDFDVKEDSSEYTEPEMEENWAYEEDSKSETKKEDEDLNQIGDKSYNMEADTEEDNDVVEGQRDAEEHYEIWTNKNIETENETGDKDGMNKVEEEIYRTEIRSSNMEANDHGDQKESLDPRESANQPEYKEKEEENSKPQREKTAWEIGEERQRLLDEGLVKIEDDESEPEAEAEPEPEQQSRLGCSGNGCGDNDDDDDEDEQINRMVSDGDMEALASIILNGEGSKLVGKVSENPEVQAFLENLPSYMNKIAAVHKAVRCGSLKDLQATLDRRRFAVAKESAEKLGVTPLHVAVLLQKPHIVKYLGGRFPETLSFKDNFGRTPLHYAAVLPDDGNFFNLLLNLGSDRKVKDSKGLTPGDYYDNPNALTHERLMEEYDAPAQMAKDMLSGQDYVLFGAEDGKYLAEALGGPLIRGLTQVANKRPRNPIGYLADFLYEFLNKNNEPERPQKGDEIAEDRVQSKWQGPVEREPDTFEDPDCEPGPSFAVTERDEFGQSILHFAAARAHNRTGLFQLIQESGANLGCRDELYRTARDVAMQADIRENMNEIDKYVISLAARGETEKIKELYLEGYDHIVDLKDDDAESIVAIASNKNQEKTAAFLKAIPSFEANRERMHEAIREGNFKLVRDIIGESKSGKLTVIGKNTSGRCSLHIAVLCQQKEITEFLAQKYPESLKIGDNLERTAMHYAMGVDEVETLSRILIKCGAQRISKDLKGRQPTYYFMNKSEISKLQEEESC